MPIDVFKGVTFTDEQKAIIAHPPFEHGRVLASPGTGKSTTAAALAQALLGSDPQPTIKFLTFTRAATAELSKKLSDRVGMIGGASTIHSFSVSALLRNPGCASFPHPLRIPDGFEYNTLIRPHLAQRVGVGVRRLDEFVVEMAAKWESLDPTESPNISPEERARFMGAWMQHRHVFGYTLLDELPDLFRSALRDNQDLIGVDYRLLIVDEYQDLNACDLEVIKRLSGKGAAVLAIGDDDQSIYSFRKADPVGIRRFLDEYKTKNDYPLSICFRSPQRIIAWAQYVIRGDIDREERPSPQFGDNAPEGICALLGFRNDITEAQGIAEIITWLSEVRHVSLSDILVLSRTDRYGAMTNRIKSELANRGIETSDPNAMEILLNDRNNRRLLAILHLIGNRIDSLAWWSLLHLQRGVGPQFMDYIFSEAIQANISFGEALESEALTCFQSGPPISRAPAMQLWQDVTTVLNGIVIPQYVASKWGKWVVDEVTIGHFPPCTDTLKELLVNIDDLVEDDQDLGRFLSQIQPLGKDLLQSKSTRVRFMTMGGSKGLTVKATIIVGVDNDLIPRPQCDLAEERRLLYVAMTRSEEYLFLTWANRRSGPAARSGRANTGRRQPTDFLRGGPIDSEDGQAYIRRLAQHSR